MSQEQIWVIWSQVFLLCVFCFFLFPWEVPAFLATVLFKNKYLWGLFESELEKEAPSETYLKKKKTHRILSESENLDWIGFERFVF